MWDAAIIGQGIAGTTLAWQLRWLGWRVAVIDREEAVTCSKIAAGLITPITGQRGVLSWRVAELFPAAREFYRKVESLTGTQIFYERPAVRFFQSREEREIWKMKAQNPEFQNWVTAPQPCPLVDGAVFHAPHGGIEMRAAQLDAARFLETSREVFRREGTYFPLEIDPVADLSLTKDGVEIPKLSLRCRWVVFCQGIASRDNPLFRWIPFKAAKGEILTLRADLRGDPRAFHADIWLTPAGGEVRVGSTYDWQQLDQIPTLRGRDQILTKLQTILRQPVEVIGHAAAVRPIIRESKALLGIHPVHERVAFFNGLGSKGSLHAPFFAGHLAKALAGMGEIDDEVDLRKNF